MSMSRLPWPQGSGTPCGSLRLMVSRRNDPRPKGQSGPLGRQFRTGGFLFGQKHPDQPLHRCEEKNRYD